MNIFIVVSLVRLTIISYYSLSRIVVITNGALFHSLYDTELTRSLWCSFVYEAVRARIWPNFDHIYIENSFSRRRRRTSRRASRFEPSFCYATALYETRGEPFNARYVYYIYGTWNGVFIWKRKFQRFESLLYEEHTSWSITRNWCMERVRNCLLSFRTEFPFHQKIAKEILFRMHNVQIRSKEEES